MSRYRKWQAAARVEVYKDRLEEAGVFPFVRAPQRFETEEKDQHKLAALMAGIWSKERCQELLEGPQFLGLTQWLRELWPQGRLHDLVYGNSPFLSIIPNPAVQDGSAYIFTHDAVYAAQARANDNHMIDAARYLLENIEARKK